MVYVISHRWGTRLPHIETPDRTYYVTFVTRRRRVLTPEERDAVLATVLRGHGVSYALYVAIVMPDHLHFIATPFPQTTLVDMIKFVKSVSAHDMGARRWQRGYFDRIVRRDEDLRRFAEYVVENSVRAGLVARVDEYRWLWRSWHEGRG